MRSIFGKQLGNVVKKICIVILDWLGIHPDWIFSSFPVITILYATLIIELVFPEASRFTINTPYNLSQFFWSAPVIIIPAFYSFVLLGTYWKRQKIFNIFQNEPSIIYDRIRACLILEMISITYGVSFGIYSIIQFYLPDELFGKNTFWVSVFIVPNILSIIGRGCLRKSSIAGFFVNLYKNHKVKTNFLKRIFIKKEILIIVFAIATFGTFHILINYVDEILKASVCTSENIQSYIYPIQGHYIASCNANDGIKNDYLFHTSGGGLMALLFFEFYFLSRSKQFPYGMLVSITMASYQFAGMVIETINQDIFYQEWSIVYNWIVYSVTASCFVIGSWNVLKKKEVTTKGGWLLPALAVVVTFSLISGLVLFQTYAKPGENNTKDLPNWLTLVVGTAFAFILALIIFWIQSKNEKRLRVAVGYIKGKVTEDREDYQTKKDAFDRIIRTIFDEMRSLVNEIVNDSEKLVEETNDLRIKIIKGKILAQDTKLSKLAKERLDIQIPNASQFHDAAATENYTLISNLCKKNISFDATNKSSKISAHITLQNILPEFIQRLDRSLDHSAISAEMMEEGI